MRIFIWNPSVKDTFKDKLGMGTLFGFYGPKLEYNRSLIGPPGNHSPGEVIGTRHGAILVRLNNPNIAIWFSHMKMFPNCKHLKVPANHLIKSTAELPEEKACPELPMYTHPETFQEIYMWKEDGIIYLHFDFYNGACSTTQLKRLQAVIENLGYRSDFHTLVLMGGRTYFGNGINLNTIEAADYPSVESLKNINAIDDVILEFVKLEDKCVVASLSRNAGAGGVMMTCAADFTISNQSIVLNPGYAAMGLYGSEYWTYFYVNRAKDRGIDEETYMAPMKKGAYPIGAQEATKLGLVDVVLGFNAEEQEKLLPGHLASMKDQIDLFVQNKKKLRTKEFYKTIHEHRVREIEKMKVCFASDEYINGRAKFVYH
jgi:putative two-component system hydrogenase maturation factor HypX/HoxX